MTQESASNQHGHSAPPRGATKRPDAALLAACAIAVALVCGLHHGILALSLAREQRPYMPLAVEGADPVTLRETLDSAPRIQDVLDGHPFSADPTGFEHKGRLPFFAEGMLDSLAAGAVGLLLGRNVQAVFILCDFILPPLCFLILAAVCRRLGAPLWVSIAGGAAAVLANEALVAPFAGMVGAPAEVHPLAFTGLTMPQMAFIPAGLAVLGLLALHDQPRPRRAVFAGCMIGLTAYCAVEFWAWVMVGGALLFVAAARRSEGRRAMVWVLTALTVGLVISMPVVLQLIAPNGYAGKAELVQRRIAEAGFSWGEHLPVLLLVAVLAILYPKRRRETASVLCFAMAALLCLGANALVPFAVDASRWTDFCALPWASLMLVLLLWAGWSAYARRHDRAEDKGSVGPDIIRARERDQSVVFGVIALLAAVYGCWLQCSYALQARDAHTPSPERYEVLTQLGMRLDDNVVLCLDPDLRGLLPATTRCELYLPRAASSPMSDDEIIDRLGVAAAAYGLTEEAPAGLLKESGPGSLANWLFPGGPPAGVLEKVMDRAELYGPDALDEALHRADIVIWSAKERSCGTAKAESAFADRLFLEAGDVKVYRAHPLPPDEPIEIPLNIPEIEVEPDGEEPGRSDAEVRGEDADRADDRPGAGVDRAHPALPAP